MRNHEPCYGPRNDDSALTACGAATCQPATGPGAGAAVRTRHGDRRRRGRDLAPDGVRRQRCPELIGGPRARPVAGHVRTTRGAGAGDRREPARAVAGRARRRDRRGLPRLGRGRARSPASRPAGERGVGRSAVAQDHRLVADGPRVVPARERDPANPGSRRSRRDGRLLAGRRHRRRDPRPTRLGPQDRSRDRAQAYLCAVTRRHDPERAARYGAGRGCECGRRSSKLGRVADISRFERQSLGRFAADGGNNVAIQVYPSATLGVP